MNNQTLYLAKIEKQKRTRIKICFEGPLAMAVFVACYPPANAGSGFTWEIKEAQWDLTNEEEKRSFEQFINGCQKEVNRNFRIAMEEALKFGKFISRLKKLEEEIQGEKFYNSSYDLKYHAGIPFSYTSANTFPKNKVSGETIHPRLIDYVPLVSIEEIMTKILTIKEGRS